MKPSTIGNCWPECAHAGSYIGDSTMLPDNHGMMRIAARVGFEVRGDPGDTDATAVRRLLESSAAG